MLIELIRVLEFIVTCVIVFTLIYMMRRWWIHHERREDEKKAKLREEHYRQVHGPHGSSVTIKSMHKKRIEEEWKF